MFSNSTCNFLNDSFMLIPIDNGSQNEKSRSATKSTRVNDRSEQSVFVYKTFRAISSFVGVWFTVMIAQGSGTKRKPQDRKFVGGFRTRGLIVSQKVFFCRNMYRACVNFLYRKNRSLISSTISANLLFLIFLLIVNGKILLSIPKEEEAIVIH